MTERQSRVCKVCAGRGVFRWASVDGACSDHATGREDALREPIVPIVNMPACGELVCEALGYCVEEHAAQ